jgi:DNA-directed RNA polymerase subunit RPC12/RpoP
MTSTNLNNDSIELLCHQCGQTFSAFLHEMADQNAKVVCPNCKANLDCNRPASGKPAAKL